jgi:hypothetical protein
MPDKVPTVPLNVQAGAVELIVYVPLGATVTVIPVELVSVDWACADPIIPETRYQARMDENAVLVKRRLGVMKKGLCTVLSC